MHHLASLLISQEIFLQALIIVDTRLLRLFLVKSISCAILAQICEISGLNHPLAGQTVRYSVKIVTVENDPDQSEILY